MANGGTTSGRSARHAVLTYNLLRLALLAACLGLGWLAGLRGAVLIVVALLVSGALSWFWLRPQREAMGQAIGQSVERSRLKLAERTAAEDAALDASEAEAQPPSRELATPQGDQPAS